MIIYFRPKGEVVSRLLGIDIDQANDALFLSRRPELVSRLQTYRVPQAIRSLNSIDPYLRSGLPYDYYTNSYRNQRGLLPDPLHPDVLLDGAGVDGSLGVALPLYAGAGSTIGNISLLLLSVLLTYKLI